MRRDGTGEPGDKVRCRACQLMIELLPVEESPFPRWQWTSRKTGTDCNPKNPQRRSRKFHEPTRVVTPKTADVTQRETMVA